ncbi:LacI family transcriptional regulator [Rhodobacter sp. JA431]|uniref:LacI family DNA-binding transcriptional regulator n=1 Tax=Rhodobacter sp. JA431 TaxID=570013 RepID=UPI000BDAEF57|nr:LacI family DNA-binding transcriptional regulator [Rhodobacter sp. JA431]SOC03918.1 LacI family transcriptional regulator [Rhodobacter sp. JA431]
MSDHDKQKPRISDIALLAGVGTATVDRVLNGRPGVRSATVEKVRAAERELAASGARPKLMQPAPAGLALRAFLGGPPGFANDNLGRCLRATARQKGVALRLDFVKRTDVVTLAEALLACLGDGAGGVIVQPVEHPLVRDAIGKLIAAGVPVVSVLTTLPGLTGLPYIGLDNRAAGRLAGQIMGNMMGKKGKIAYFFSEAIYRSHEEREAGLRSILREDFPAIEVVETLSTNDTPEECFRLATTLLKRFPALEGIVNFAAGNRGIERALSDAGRARDLCFVTFNLTALSRAALIEGRMAAVIHQDMQVIASRAVAAVIAQHRGTAPDLRPIPAELILRENIRDLDGE